MDIDGNQLIPDLKVYKHIQLIPSFAYIPFGTMYAFINRISAISAAGDNYLMDPGNSYIVLYSGFLLMIICLVYSFECSVIHFQLPGFAI